MAGKQQKGNRFFSFDVDFFSDKKIKILKARYGADGIAVYIYLLCEIYKNGYYLKVDDDFEYIISDDLAMTPDKVKQVLTFLLSRSLLDSKLFQSDAVLTSAGIQRRYQQMVKSRALKTPIKIESFWLLSEEETESFIKVHHFLNNSEKNDDVSKKDDEFSEKKALKEKENNIYIYITPTAGKYFENEELNNAFFAYLNMRAEKGDKLTDEQIRLLKERLMLIGKDENEQLNIVKSATMNGWKNFYAANKQQNNIESAAKKQQYKKSTNRFNNFQQRKNDISSIEEALMKKRRKVSE